MKQPGRANQTGQMTVELILLAVTLTSIFLFVGRQLNANAFLVQIIQSPWTNRVSGMIENGVWGPAEQTRALHPNLIRRHASLQGDRP